MVSDLISKANEFLINSSHNIIDNEYKFELINEKHSSSIIEWRNDISCNDNKDSPNFKLLFLGFYKICRV